MISLIEQIYIKSVALIDELTVEFNSGLNILSGETGAGKSIIIDSINFVLGEKTDKNFIKSGADKAIVEALIYINNEDIRNEIEATGIEIEDDNSILINRVLNISGKSSCKVNGKSITLTMLKQISALLIDIHGQHQHQSLLNPAKHILLLDRFCPNELNIIKSELSEYIKLYKDIIKNINESGGNESEREERIELYSYQVREIEEASLTVGEEEELLNSRKLLVNSEKLKSLSNECLNLLYLNEDFSASDEISTALDNLYSIAEFDNDKEELCSRLEEVNIQLKDIISELTSYNEQIEYNPEELERIDDRLDFIYKLKKKYGNSIEEILAYSENISNKLDKLLNSNQTLIELNQKKLNFENKIKDSCNKITEIRKDAAELIQDEIEAVLKDLGMLNAEFNISITNKTTFNNNGRDKVEFLIAPNSPAELKPLSKIASGGEMSRVMLSLKTVLAKADNIETFIFDEIDTGVSGRTAQQVAEKLAFIAKTHQILCITHLPQIAAMGDSNYLIEKKTINLETKTEVNPLDNKGIILELARLTGGAEITESTLAAASEMKEMAIKLKQTL